MSAPSTHWQADSDRLDPELDLCSAAHGPFFNDHHHELRGRLLTLRARRAELSGDPREAVREMGRLGLLAYLVPEAHGGASLGRAKDPRFVDVRSLVLIREALAQVSPMADAIFAVLGLGSFPVSAFGSEAQRSAVLPGLIAGTTITAFALTEREAGTDVASLQTTAVAAPNGYILNGEKFLISNVGIADTFVVFANAEPAKGRKGIAAFLVPANTLGLGFEQLPMTSPHPLGSLQFSDAALPASARIGEAGQGFRIAMETLDAFRISVGAAANGMAARALSLALAHVKTRTQFGKPLAEQQQIQAYLAEMATDLDAARLLVLRAAHARDTHARDTHARDTHARDTHARDGKDLTKLAAMAKMFATEAAQRTVDRAVQLHGGRGVLLGSEVEALYRDVRPLRIYEGTTEIQRVVIAKALLG